MHRKDRFNSSEPRVGFPEGRFQSDGGLKSHSTAIQKPYHFLLIEILMVLAFWYWLTQVVLEKAATKWVFSSCYIQECADLVDRCCLFQRCSQD